MYTYRRCIKRNVSENTQEIPNIECLMIGVQQDNTQFEFHISQSTHIDNNKYEWSSGSLNKSQIRPDIYISHQLFEIRGWQRRKAKEKKKNKL